MARTRRARPRPPQRLILDSGAVIARAFLARALELRAPVEVPVVVVAETVRGGPRDAPVNRVLKAVGAVPEARETHGRLAGRLLGHARSSATVDALVVAHAVAAGGGLVLTGDAKDFRPLSELHPEVRIQPL